MCGLACWLAAWAACLSEMFSRFLSANCSCRAASLCLLMAALSTGVLSVHAYHRFISWPAVEKCSVTRTTKGHMPLQAKSLKVVQFADHSMAALLTLPSHQSTQTVRDSLLCLTCIYKQMFCFSLCLHAPCKHMSLMEVSLRKRIHALS